MSDRPLFVATWKFGKAVSDKALEVFQSGHSMLDAIEQGIWVAEADAKNSTVGYGGTPNADGEVELDACIMSGPGHAAGSVAAIQDNLHPITIARKVMENTPHVMLAGDGARRYAAKIGYEPTEMLSSAASERFKKWKKEKGGKSEAPHQNKKDDRQKDKDFDLDSEQYQEPEHHDTVALIGIDAKGDLYGGCSTSGWGFKVPGRVGDSPIIGSGLYVDNEIGAVGSTGTGENVMRYCASFWITQLMGQGAAPVEAIEKVIREIARKDPLGMDKLAVNFIALNKDGDYGAVGTSNGFVYATTDVAHSEVKKATILS